jgi:hypothetical protein
MSKTPTPGQLALLRSARRHLRAVEGPWECNTLRACYRRGWLSRRALRFSVDFAVELAAGGWSATPIRGLVVAGHLYSVTDAGRAVIPCRAPKGPKKGARRVGCDCGRCGVCEAGDGVEVKS